MPLLPDFGAIREGNQAQREERRKAREKRRSGSAAAATKPAELSLRDDPLGARRVNAAAETEIRARRAAKPSTKPLAHPVSKPTQMQTGGRGTHHAAPTGTPPMARPGPAPDYSNMGVPMVPASKVRTASGMPFTEAAKVTKAKTTASKSSSRKAAASAPKPRPESAPRKGGLLGLLGRNAGNQQELARKRQAKAARKD